MLDLTGKEEPFVGKAADGLFTEKYLNNAISEAISFSICYYIKLSASKNINIDGV